ncbi:MAG: hypothetical protein VB858_02480 [Planctomycetaceae bacterium]
MARKVDPNEAESAVFATRVSWCLPIKTGDSPHDPVIEMAEMNDMIPQDVLAELSVEEVAALLEFVEQMGSYEAARAALDIIFELRTAA